MMSGEHPLLESRSPAYSHATVRRALIVWLRCGRQNNFHDVCNYFHHLEAMEEKLPASRRESSRNHEFSLFANQPPTSLFQQKLFPLLYTPNESGLSYSTTYVQNHFYRNIDYTNNIIKVEDMQEPGEYTAFTHQDIFNASQIFKYPQPSFKKTEEHIKKPADAFNTLYNNVEGLEKHNFIGKKKSQVVITSEMINNYCTEKQIPLRDFLEDFRDFCMRCQLNNTVNTVAIYINKKTIQEELKLAAVMHKAKRYNNANKQRRAKRAARRLKMGNTKIKSNGVELLNYYDIIDKMTESESEESESKDKDDHEIIVEDSKLTNDAKEVKDQVQEEEDEFLDAEVFNITSGEEEKYTDASTSICETQNECEKTETSFEDNDVLIQIDINLNSAKAKMEIISSGSDKSEGEEEFLNDGAIILSKRKNCRVKNNNAAFSSSNFFKL